MDLLHRMSTQDVKNLSEGEGAATVLTTDIARIIDRLLLAVTADTVYVLTGTDNSDAIARYLMRYVFFNDDFQVEDVSAQTAVWGVYGAGAAAVVADLGVDDELPLFHWRSGRIDGEALMVQKVDPVYGDGYLIRGSLAAGDALAAHWADSALLVATEAQFEAVRIAAGVPQFGTELTDAYIPLEADLWADVSFHKGVLHWARDYCAYG